MQSLQKYLSLPISTYVLRYSVLCPWELRDGCDEFKVISRNMERTHELMTKMITHNRIINLKLLKTHEISTLHFGRMCWLNTSIQYGTIGMIKYCLTLTPADSPVSNYPADRSDMYHMLRFYLAGRDSTHDDTYQILGLYIDYFKSSIGRGDWLIGLVKVCIDQNIMYAKMLMHVKEAQGRLLIYSVEHQKYDVARYIIDNWTLSDHRLRLAIGIYMEHGSYDSNDKAFTDIQDYMIGKYSNMVNLGYEITRVDYKCTP